MIQTVRQLKDLICNLSEKCCGRFSIIINNILYMKQESLRKRPLLFKTGKFR